MVGKSCAIEIHYPLKVAVIIATGFITIWRRTAFGFKLRIKDDFLGVNLATAVARI
jgi:ABC-type uncharacterized transport system permease subunit